MLDPDRLPCPDRAASAYLRTWRGWSLLPELFCAFGLDGWAVRFDGSTGGNTTCTATGRQLVVRVASPVLGCRARCSSIQFPRIVMPSWFNSQAQKTPGDSAVHHSLPGALIPASRIALGEGRSLLLRAPGCSRASAHPHRHGSLAPSNLPGIFDRILHMPCDAALLSRAEPFAAKLDVPADAEVISKLIYDVGQISGVRVYQRMASC